jgi:sulfur relay (sulfurtransferase) DsrF/TusC family protein
MRQMLAAHMYDRKLGIFAGNETGRLNVGFRNVHVSFDVDLTKLFTGDLIDVEMVTRLLDPDAPDTPHPTGILLHFRRGYDSLVNKCVAELESISKKPSHGLRTGRDALDTAIALCRHVGCSAVNLLDASSIQCAGQQQPTAVHLRKALILSRGVGWYESRGFRGIVESLDPVRFRRMVPRLHKIRLVDLLKGLRKHDALLRSSLLDAGAAARMGVIRYHAIPGGDEALVVPPTVDDLLDMMSRVSFPLQVLEEKNLKLGEGALLLGTLGGFVEELMSSDCVTAAKFTDALLPWHGTYVVLRRGPDGRPVEPLPQQDAWVYVWRVFRVNTKLTLSGARQQRGAVEGNHSIR